MIVINGLSCFHGFGAFTCYSYAGGKSVVDYGMRSLSMMRKLSDLCVYHMPPLADHASATFKIHFST
jgi:hypothetical protein